MPLIAESGDGLSEHQYGLRHAHSTVGTINTFVNLAKVALTRREYCAVLLLDLKNVFNRTSCNGIT